MSNLQQLPYAEWLEESLRNIIGKPVKAICIITKVQEEPIDEDDSGEEIGCGYWNATCADKLTFAGFLQQDAMLDTLKLNGYITDDEDEEDSDYGEEEMS